MTSSTHRAQDAHLSANEDQHHNAPTTQKIFTDYFARSSAGHRQTLFASSNQTLEPTYYQARLLIAEAIKSGAFDTFQQALILFKKCVCMPQARHYVVNLLKHAQVPIYTYSAKLAEQQQQDAGAFLHLDISEYVFRHYIEKNLGPIFLAEGDAANPQSGRVG